MLRFSSLLAPYARCPLFSNNNPAGFMRISSLSCLPCYPPCQSQWSTLLLCTHTSSISLQLCLMCVWKSVKCIRSIHETGCVCGDKLMAKVIAAGSVKAACGPCFPLVQSPCVSTMCIYSLFLPWYHDTTSWLC